VRIDGTGLAVAILALSGGVTLAIQNLLLAGMVGRGLASITALALNSLVGVTLLLVINLAWHGTAVVGTVAQSWQPWFLLPGILGTFVVFAMLIGYTRAGATIPTASLITGQLLAVALIDQFRAQGPGPLGPLGWLGIALLIAGATLVIFAPRG
jgi:transporter family-2 protein